MSSGHTIDELLAAVPTSLGRGLVLAVDHPIPAAFADVDMIEITDATLVDASLLNAVIVQLHLAWVAGDPVVIRWGIEADSWSQL